MVARVQTRNPGFAGRRLLSATRSWGVLLTLAVALLVQGCQVQALRPSQLGLEEKQPPEDPLYHWALLMAGSQEWWNYRHQADVCHAYQILKANGVPEDRIIVMVYDDIAESIWNPYPGQIFNKPGGEDVYPGCAKDYVGEDITAEIFLAVLTGNETAVKGHGSERVMKSGPTDRVFVYYSDHGAPGILATPTGPFLFADEVIGALESKAAKNEFKELVFYVEACESGSIFEGLLPTNISVYAMTAANASESSWAAYCPDWGDVEVTKPVHPNATELGTCMGDLFSVSFLEDTENCNIDKETLHSQYERVKKRTSNNMTFEYGSHVEIFGEVNMTSEVTGDFLGILSPTAKIGNDKNSSGCNEVESFRPENLVRQRDGEIATKLHRFHAAQSLEDKHKVQRDLDATIVKRELVDSSIRNTVKYLLLSGKVFGVWAKSSEESLVDSLVLDSHGRPRQGVPLVDNWDCLRGMVNIWEGECGKMDSYASKHTRAFANLCNAYVSLGDFAIAVAGSGCKGGIPSRDNVVIS